MTAVRGGGGHLRDAHFAVRREHRDLYEARLAAGVTDARALEAGDEVGARMLAVAAASSAHSAGERAVQIQGEQVDVHLPELPSEPESSPPSECVMAGATHTLTIAALEDAAGRAEAEREAASAPQEWVAGAVAAADESALVYPSVRQLYYLTDLYLQLYGRGGPPAPL